MQYRYHFCDPVASFGVGSTGRRLQRIVDHSEEPKLGFDVWQLGCRAYDLLGTESGEPVTLADLRAVEKSGQIVLDLFFGELNSMADSGRIALVSAEGKSPLDLPIAWQKAEWSWQVSTFAKCLAAITAANRDKGVAALDQPSYESMPALMLVAVLHLLDEAVLASYDHDAEGVAAKVLEAAWLLEQVEAPERISTAAAAIAKDLDRLRASERARARHAKDPKRAAREFVKQCWRAWREQPQQYASVAAFARAMLDKQPDVLKSEVVIARWVRGRDNESAET